MPMRPSRTIRIVENDSSGKNLRGSALRIVRRLQEAGFTAYWVGGCVRDLLLGSEPHDYDIATSALAEKVEALFPRTVPVGRKFGVVIVLESGQPFQVATFRAESRYQDGRHPDQVEFGDPKADAERRDFTINGLFYDPVRGQLHDWVGGEADLRDRLLRAIGNPEERFAEDHLRLLRAVRLSAVLSFQIEPGTWEAVRKHAALIQSISAERIHDELMRIFRPPHAAQGLELLRASRLLPFILPEIAALIGCEQSPQFHPEGDVYVHTRRMLELLPPDACTALCWAALLHDIGKPVTRTDDPATGEIHFYEHESVGAEMSEALLQRLRFPRREIDEIVACVRQHMQFKDVPAMRQSTRRRLMLRPTFPTEIELHRLDCLASHGRLDIYDQLKSESDQMARQPQLRPPLLRGKDLLEMGLAPGPRVGQLLNAIRDKQLQEELKTPEEARAWALEQIQSHRRSP